MPGVNKAFQITARHVITPAEDLGDGRVTVSGKTVTRVQPDSASRLSDATISGEYLIPGMIDLQINGIRGVDFARATVGDLASVSAWLPRSGCTGYLPTLITAPEPELLKQLENLSGAIAAVGTGARPLGIHLEGPFLNPDRAGAHPAESFVRPSVDLFGSFCRASGDMLRILTLAPELDGALALVEQARRRIPVVSMGHSMAECQIACRAIEAGINMVTHGFNAGPAIHQRRPGMLVAGILSPRVAVGVIADGLHVAPQLIRLLCLVEGSGVVAVTDAVSAAGMPDGSYGLGEVRIEKRGLKCRTSDGVLAGSVATMDVLLRNLAAWLEESGGGLATAVEALTSRPADLLGLERKGRIRQGFDADLVLLDRRLRVLKTWVEGELTYDSGARE